MPYFQMAEKDKQAQREQRLQQQQQNGGGGRSNDGGSGSGAYSPVPARVKQVQRQSAQMRQAKRMAAWAEHAQLLTYSRERQHRQHSDLVGEFCQYK